MCPLNKFRPIDESFQRWYQGQPDDADGFEDCVEYNSLSFNNHWNDVRCDAELYVACVGYELTFSRDPEKSLNCEPKKCVCLNGDPVEDGECTIHGGNQCRSCDRTHILDDDRNCIPRQCGCVHLDASGDEDFSMREQGRGMVGVDCFEYNAEGVACGGCAPMYHSIALNKNDDKYLESYSKSFGPNAKPGYCVLNECWCLRGTPKSLGNCREDYRDPATGFPITKPQSFWIKDESPWDTKTWPLNDCGHECDTCFLNEKYENQRVLENSQSNHFNILCTDRACDCKFGTGLADGACNSIDAFHICEVCDDKFIREARGYYEPCDAPGDTPASCAASFSLEQARSHGLNHRVIPDYKFIPFPGSHFYDWDKFYTGALLNNTHLFTVCEECDYFYHKSMEIENFGKCVPNQCQCAHGRAVEGNCMLNGNNECAMCDPGYAWVGNN